MKITRVRLHVLAQDPPCSGERQQMLEDIQKADPGRIIAFIGKPGNMVAALRRAYELVAFDKYMEDYPNILADPPWHLDTPPWAEEIPISRKPWAQQHSRRYRKD